MNDRLQFSKHVEVIKVHENVSQETIYITVDRIRLILHLHCERLAQSKDWIAPFGLLLSVLVTFVTTEFKAWLLPADSWRAVFFLAGVGAGVWLAWAVVRGARALTIEDLIGKMKQQSVGTEAARTAGERDGT